VPRAAGWNGDMRLKLGSTAALVLCLIVASPARAASHADELKSQTDDLLGKLDSFSHGLLKWEGADRLDIREEGDTAIADIANARISIGSPEAKPAEPRVRVEFDHIEVRHAPAPGGAVALSVALPPQSILHTADGSEITLTLTDATVKAILDAKSGRARESTLAFASARIADQKSGDWVALGPLSFSSKLVGAADGGWTTPIDFELKQIEFFFTEGPVGGAIDRIAYTARSAGPDLAALNRLRDQLDALREKDDAPPKERMDALVALLPTIPSLFSQAKGELAIEGVVARAPTGEPYVALAKASIGGALTGLSSDAASLRITLRHDGLTLAPTILDAAKVPRRAIVDVGLEDVGTGPLRSLLEAAGKMREGASEADKEHAQQQMIGAAAMLNPVFRIYDFAVDTPAVGVDATAEAKGSPLSPKGYTAQGDVTVRGFDALPALVGDASVAAYLPLLKEIGTGAAAPDGTPRTKFHLASAPPKWITLNGSDVSAWFLGSNAATGEARILRPAQPPMTGVDVRAVQRALAAAKIAAPQNDSYDGATAAAVARFQKQNGLNVDGVVDTATRQKLGIKPELPQPAEPGGSPPGRRG
jgi:hypothetical protein